MSISSRGFDPRSALFFVNMPFFSPRFCLAPFGFNRVPLRPYILYCTTYIPGMHFYIRTAAAAVAALCVAILLLLLQLRLLAVTVIVC